MNQIFRALVLAGLVTVPVLATAADSPHKLSANVSLTSNYVFRGISQTAGEPAIQGGFDYTHSSGIYAGTWASNVGWIEDFQLYESGNVEIDLYGGYRGSIGQSDFTYDLGGIWYIYPGERAGAIHAGTGEVYAALGWKWFTVKYSYYVTDQVFGVRGASSAEGSDYFDIAASLPIGDTGLTAAAHWGTFNFDGAPAADYEDWKVSLAYDLGKLGDLGSGMTAGLMYTDTNAKGFWTDFNGEYLGKGTTTVWLSKSF